MDKIQIPTPQDRKIKLLETEAAELWYENILLADKVDKAEKKSEAAELETAEIWYTILMGGAV